MPRFNPDALRAARRAAEMQIHVLAVKTDIGPSTIQRAETGKNVPSAEHVAALAAALEVPMESLFTADPVAS